MGTPASPEGRPPAPGEAEESAMFEAVVARVLIEGTEKSWWGVEPGGQAKLPRAAGPAARAGGAALGLAAAPPEPLIDFPFTIEQVRAALGEGG